jgi:hypothetical protein
VSAISSSVANADNIVLSQESSHGNQGSGGPAVMAEPSLRSWPSETNLIIPPKANNMTLNSQHPIVREVIRNAFDSIHADLMFKNAFPDLYDMLEFISDGLLMAAESHEKAMDIYDRLVYDHTYSHDMSRLVSIQFQDIKYEVTDPFSASCTDSPFPSGNKGTLRCYCTW